MRGRSRWSIPTRIFFGFTIVLVSFGTVAAASVIQHRRTSQTLELLHQGYLPLALTLGEAKATQAVFATLLDRLQQGPQHQSTKNWLNAARRVRPATLRRAFGDLDRAQSLGQASDEKNRVPAIRRELDAVRRAFETNDQRYDALFALMERGGDERAAPVLAELRERERAIQRHYRHGWRRIQEQVAETSAQAAEHERRSALWLGALTLLSLAVGIAVLWWSQRLLKPLPLLHKRVSAVARGDLSVTALESTRDDEVGRLAAEFERMVAALAARDARLRQTERLAAIGRMAAHVAHEVRNPLSSIGLNVELLEDELLGRPAKDDAGRRDVRNGHAQTPDEIESRALIAAIQRELDRLTDITGEYLRLARVPEPALETGDIGSMIEEVVRFVKPEMDACGVDVSVHLDSTLSPVAMDQAQLRQALLNLLRNAREAMPEGGVIQLTAEQQSERVAVAVRDYGNGISETEREIIFDLFYSTKERGTGLGLPLTQQIIAAHGGEIQCRTPAGGGTTFEVWLPTASRESLAPTEPIR